MILRGIGATDRWRAPVLPRYPRPMRIALVLASTVLLSACSGEPSESDLKRVVDGQYNTFNASTKSFGITASAAQFNVHSVKKVGCKKGSAPKEFACDVEVDVTAPLIGRSKSVKNIRVQDNGDAWQVLNVF